MRNWNLAMVRVIKSLECYRGLAMVASAMLLLSAGHAQNLSPQSAKVTDLNGQPTGISAPGQEFLFTIPLENTTTAVQTNVIGVAAPLTPGMIMVDPASDYGNIATSGTAEGTPYRGKLDTSVTLQRRYDVVVGVKSDQEQFDTEVSLQGSTGFGNGSQLAAWPPAGYGSGSGTIAEAAGPTAVELTVVSTSGLRGGTLYRNQRTGELIAVNSLDPAAKKLRVRRGQYGSVPPTDVQAGDVLAYEGVPIPDAVRAGVAMKVTVNPVPGYIGDIKVNVENIVHPRVGDLIFTLEAEGISAGVKETTPVILLAPLEGGLANGANISNVSFADDGTTDADSQTGTLAPGVTYVPSEFLDTFADIDGADVTTWTLRVSDISAPVFGYIKGGWSIEPAE